MHHKKWRLLCKYKIQYKIYSSGKIKRLARTILTKRGFYRTLPARTLKQRINQNGYKVVTLNNHGKGKEGKIHTLILEAFVGPRPKGKQARHLDGNKLNNHPTNLKWGTPKRNCKDRDKHGTTIKGEKINTAKLTEKKVKRIRKLFLTHSASSLAAKFEVSIGHIYNIIKRFSWKHVSN